MTTTNKATNASKYAACFTRRNQCAYRGLRADVEAYALIYGYRVEADVTPSHTTRRGY